MTQSVASTPTLAASCGSGGAAPLGRDEAADQAGLLKAVADPARLQILSIIRSASSRDACLCDLTDALGLAQPTVSHHLKVLVDAGLLRREARGTWAWYSLVPGRFAQIARTFDPEG